MAEVVTFSGVLDRIRAVDGWMTDDQARRLWQRAGEVPAGGQIVEIGSFRGRSTIVLASAAAPGVGVVAIDPHAGNDRGPQEISGHEAEAALDHEAFLANLEDHGVAGRVRHVRRFSDEAHDLVEGPIDLLYIDGAHRWRPASTDISDWGDRVRPGGVMLIHDSFSSLGVTLAQMSELFWSSDFRYEGRSRSMTQYRRTQVRGRARVANAWRQALGLPWFVRNVVVKALIVARLRPLTRLLAHDQRQPWPY